MAASLWSVSVPGSPSKVTPDGLVPGKEGFLTLGQVAQLVGRQIARVPPPK